MPRRDLTDAVLNALPGTQPDISDRLNLSKAITIHHLEKLEKAGTIKHIPGTKARIWVKIHDDDKPLSSKVHPLFSLYGAFHG